MKTEIRPRGALRLTPCNYGTSRVSFRGPMRPINGRYIAVLGGSETFGKYIAQPFPDLIETAIGEVCVNLGCQSGGPDVFLQDAAIQSLCHDAAATVIQIVGAVNQSNTFYKVHPRRNDRFIAPSEKLKALYPEIDFSEIAFTGHLIARLRAVDEDRFALVRDQLEQTWVRRMKALIGQANGPVVLLWLAPSAPRKVAQGGEPAFVTRGMLNQLRPYVADIVEVIAEPGCTDGMLFAPLEELTAREAMGPDAHIAAAKALRTPLRRGLD
ncbi:DUF6473 family protein [Octadecabacter sp. G9-8]|uniref:DUF6473 family protein n=1 Tax=Octadecabacter dasysiphoniae TaxID=2909341 RepID=A0ABS9CX45_9RHOB|nr:DUF6473 family protein [Octadecabacter dasysiphoniae]MCF2871851.1 DUF6473 family protein [Octadecabacter dasysiphoniae]